MLWVDKHRPLELGKMSYHGELSERLATLAADGDIPHLLFYGPSGAGKKTRIMALLRALYGAGAEKQRLEHRDFKTPTNKAIEVTTVASNYHIEINPSDAGNNDRYVVQEVIKEIAQSGSLHKGDKGRVGYKVVLLVEVDRLTRQAQAGLRRTMEKCTSSCRLILCCNNPSKVIDPLRSRCLGIRVAAPTEAEIVAAPDGVPRPRRCSRDVGREHDEPSVTVMLRRCWTTSRRASASTCRPRSPRASPRRRSGTCAGPS